ncbi:glycosyltransferase [Streptomyces albidoflavus]
MPTTTGGHLPSAPPRVRVLRIIARMNVGGPALQVRALMGGLDPVRFDQRLCTGTVADGEADYLEQSAPRMPVRRLDCLGRRVRPGDDLRALSRLVAEMREFRPHIVHTHTAKAGALGRTAALLAGVPARVHTFHGHLLNGYFSPRVTQLVTATERQLARSCDRLVAVGGQVRDDLLAAGVGRPEQYAVVPPGRELPPLPRRAEARARLGLPENAPVVAWVGRVTRIKRPDRLLDTAREVLRTVPGAVFLVCGEGDLLGAVRERAGELGGSVRLLGWRPDVETVYAAADAALLTSDNEGMPVSLIEASLAGLPSVATRVGSVAEVVRDGETGLLAPPDAILLARHTARLLGDPALRARLGGRARERAARLFGADRLVGDLDRLYTALAVSRGWWPTPRPEGAPC